MNDRVALRITGLYENSDSYRDGFNFERMGVNPTAAFAIGEATVVRLSYEYYDYDRTADRGMPSELGRPYVTDPSTFFGNPDRSITYATVNQGSVVIDHAFSDNVQLRNRTRLRRLQQVLPERLSRAARWIRALASFHSPPTTTSSCARTSSTRPT